MIANFSTGIGDETLLCLVIGLTLFLEIGIIWMFVRPKVTMKRTVGWVVTANLGSFVVGAIVTLLLQLITQDGFGVAGAALSYFLSVWLLEWLILKAKFKAVPGKTVLWATFFANLISLVVAVILFRLR